MTGLIILIILILLAVIILQIGKVTDIASRLRGEEVVERENNNRQGIALVIFMVLFLFASIYSGYAYRNVILGFGLPSASYHGSEIDSMFNVTLIFTGIVFVITQILTFWYAYRYRRKEGVRAQFISHNNTLELVWTLVPAIVLTFLVVKGLVAWNKIMPDTEPEDNALNIAATGYQFAWDLRLAGPDGVLGRKDYRLIDLATNPLGIDWSDEASIDDIILGGSDKLVLPKDTLVRVQITAKDVLHNFFLPHFRLKMDAVPGMPTYFKFRPKYTTEEYRLALRDLPEWNEPYDPTDPESKTRWQEFNYELACAELCGKGHYSMKRIIEVVDKKAFEAWFSQQKSFYLTNIRGTEADPRKGQLLDFEIKNRAAKLTADIDESLAADDWNDRIISLEHIFYETGSASLDKLSRYELDHLTSLLNKYPNAKVELRGHTDNVGDDDMNMNLSQNRANNVRSYLIDKGISESRLVAKGFGETLPVDTNDTPEGRLANRRTELRILSK